MTFGQSSERLRLLADQLELMLEDLEAEHAHAACVVANDVSPEAPQAGTQGFLSERRRSGGSRLAVIISGDAPSGTRHREGLAILILIVAAFAS